MRFLKQSTEVTKLIGPFLDNADGVTEETGLADAATEISKDGAAFGAGPVLGTHDSDGWYPIVLTTTHTNTIGDLMVKIHDAATHLPVWAEFHVLAANVYDSLFGAATDKLEVDAEASVGDLPTNAELATALGTADDAVLAAIAALSIPSAAAVASQVRTELTAELAKVGSMTFTVANVIDANVQRVNDIEVDGAGTPVDPWGPA